ncbi:MsnO8 family LLM class oxidoreductase [Actinoplanes sp. TBRC 11911]|uniref:MsnO8 family LLM class oxidoreductase n=1 Tax=Actinoplanes sp. TBRC 11911 TaxID=2729386 RepID=UPI00145CB1A6|nr:MsnO8 family LLM class oxidoreductase [Actinoplanes sp. TBRC 11911]NMO55411.1 MsnO8 family LLM class oxidoreductase [Actinoplanes sp. TBRC 11911]
MSVTPLSVLEIPAFVTAHPTVDVRGIIDVAQTVERLGYQRIWYAERHKSLAYPPFPPAVSIARVASATSSIRVGSGGVLAVNHAPLAVAEQFAALTAFFPTRIDLGIGKGPGTVDQATARALRPGAEPVTDEGYHRGVADILRLIGEQPDPAEAWILASSPSGARLAADLGLPMAFAYHIRPQQAVETLEYYRTAFRPSRWNDSPRVMLSIQAICAETDTEADALARPIEIHRARQAINHTDQPLLDMTSAASYEFTAQENAAVTGLREHAVQGSPRVVHERLTALTAQFGADELMLWTPIIDAKERARSFELIMGES